MYSAKDINAILEEYIRTPEGRRFLHQSGYSTHDTELSKEQYAPILQEIRDAFISAVLKVLPNFRVDCVSIEIPRKSKWAYITIDPAALRRESLYWQSADGTRVGQGAGIDDILALFTHGYTLSHRAPYGVWEKSDGTSVRTSALSHRDPNPFLENLLAYLVAKYGSTCSIVLHGDYLQ